MRSILVAAGGTDTDEIVFRAACAAAQTTGGHLDFLHLLIGPVEAARFLPQADFAVGNALPAMLAELEADSEDRAVQAKRRFKAFCRCKAIEICEHSGGSPARTASWCEDTGDAMERLMFWSRRHDLVVVGRPDRPNGLPPDYIEQLLLGCGRPLLLAPSSPPSSFKGTIMVCWKEGPAAARALTAAMPILTKAEQVVLAAVAEDDRTTAEGVAALARQLAWHGISVCEDFIAADERSASDVLLSVARSHGAELIVMGGYGKMRMRELVFGGFTQTVLAGCDVAALMLH
jgi:nucleotide-binding universal stress UspA family protein